MTIRPFAPADTTAAAAIWNRVVADGEAFPQTQPLGDWEATAFFINQSYTGVACDEDGTVTGLYILHPNNVGRCGHIANASYAVAPAARGRGVGEALVRHSLDTAAALGFRIMQFNAVVAANTVARRLYQKLGFVCVGTIPGGFCMPDGHFEDILVYYHTL